MKRRHPAGDSISGLLTVALCSLLLWSGCGRSSNNDGLMELAGKVSFQNQPVPAGRIELIPDSSKGNSGPAGYADILDGSYDTARNGKGVKKGPHIAVISGLKKVEAKRAVSDEEAATQSAPDNVLFRDIRMPVDITASNRQQDFQVPSKK